MLPRLLLSLFLALAGCARLGAAPAGAEAVLIVMGDQHSAYERTAQFVALVDSVKAANPDLPVAVLLNGDTLEQGNAIARRSAGAIDFAMFTALAQRAPTVLNVGNHEPEFYELGETVQRIEATGVRVVSNVANHATGQPFAPASTSLKLGDNTLTIIGVTTDNLSTYRAAVRPSLDLANPVVWAKANFPKILAPEPPVPTPIEAAADETKGEKAETGLTEGAAPAPSAPPALPVVLSHCGMAADRELLALVPDGTLFAGAHNHLRFVEPMGRTVYFHSGSWNEYASLAWLWRDGDGVAHWEIEQVEIPREGPAEPALAALIQEVSAKNLEPADKAVIGRTPRAMTQAEAAQFVAGIVNAAIEADATFIGNTTFGAGLPAGDVTQAEFDACVRFENTLCTAEIDGARLQALLDAANQGPDTPFAQRRGEFNYTAGPEKINPARTYRVATTDWSAKNSARYFGEPAIVWREQPALKLKALVRGRLAAAPLPAVTTAGDATKPPSLEDLYETGRMLFDAFASEEIKEQYEFPSKEQWDLFAARLQQALEGDRMEDLAHFEPEARAALDALRVLPGYEDYADWLEERVDYIEAAKQTVQTPPPPGPAPAPTPKPAPTPAPKPTPPDVAPAPTPAIPHYDLWLTRLRARPVPAGADKLMPLLRYIFAAEGVPADLAWLAEVESTLNPAARSPAGARGLFQLMPPTAKELGLSTWMPDERTDPEKSARAAAQLLKKLHTRFGSWPLALAAYNAGAGRVRRTLDKHGAKTFGEISSVLSAETRMYVPKVLATIETRTGAPLAL